MTGQYYSSLYRLRTLEHCLLFWSPHLKKDIVEPGKVQKRAAKGGYWAGAPP